jgi:hypothetical protein
MSLWVGRIKGTINDEFEVEADTEDEARQNALDNWQYVEFEDLEVSRIKEVEF